METTTIPTPVARVFKITGEQDTEAMRVWLDTLGFDMYVLDFRSEQVWDGAIIHYAVLKFTRRENGVRGRIPVLVGRRIKRSWLFDSTKGIDWDTEVQFQQIADSINNGTHFGDSE